MRTRVLLLRMAALGVVLAFAPAVWAEKGQKAERAEKPAPVRAVTGVKSTLKVGIKDRVSLSVRRPYVVNKGYLKFEQMHVDAGEGVAKGGGGYGSYIEVRSLTREPGDVHLVTFDVESFGKGTWVWSVDGTRQSTELSSGRHRIVVPVPSEGNAGWRVTILSSTASWIFYGLEVRAAP